MHIRWFNHLLFLPVVSDGKSAHVAGFAGVWVWSEKGQGWEWADSVGVVDYLTSVGKSARAVSASLSRLHNYVAFAVFNNHSMSVTSRRRHIHIFPLCKPNAIHPRSLMHETNRKMSPSHNSLENPNDLIQAARANLRQLTQTNYRQSDLCSCKLFWPGWLTITMCHVALWERRQRRQKSFKIAICNGWRLSSVRRLRFAIHWITHDTAMQRYAAIYIV